MTSKIAKTEEDYQKIYYHDTIDNIYEFIQKNPKNDLVKLFLCESDESQLDLYLFSLEKLKKEKIIKDYRIIEEDIFEAPEQKTEEITTANLKYDLELYIDKIDSKNNFPDYPPFEHHLVFAAIKKKDINQPELRKLVSDKKYIEKIELMKEGKKTVAFVNKNYSSPIKANDSLNTNSSWNKLYELAEDKTVLGNENTLKYFNYNTTNPLYSNGIYKLTKILENRRDILEKLIPITIISKAYINKSIGQTKRKK